ncbi:MAG TPA: MAPEG family protein [Xanthomonadales bacterium]|nr:MAPEG family protein [Xanthomonadales bacterium]
MTTELCYLTAAAVLTALLWVPYILDVIMRNSISEAVGYGELNRSPWGERMRKAHYNAVENLVPFAVVVLVAHAIGISDPATTMSAAVFFWARVVHAISYTFAIPWIRTLSFVAGWGAILCIAWQIYAAS